MTKYGKQVHVDYTLDIYGKEITLLVLKEGDYWNVHILDERFRDDEMNTLDHQIPTEDWSLDDFTTSWILETIYRHVIWDIGHHRGMVMVDELTIQIEEI